MPSKTNLPRKPGLRRRASAVCVDQGRVLMVRMKDPCSNVQFLSPPGGAVEENESALSAAIRDAITKLLGL